MLEKYPTVFNILYIRRDVYRTRKTIRQIASIVHMSFRNISRIIKAYDKKNKFTAI